MITREKFLCLIIVILIILNLISLYKNKKESFEVVKGTIENATKGGDKKIVLTDNDGNFSSIPSFNGLIPSGIIVSWSGRDIPKDWVPCDGRSYDRTNGSEATDNTTNENKITTPDLRGKFILGYNPQENPDSKRVSNNLGHVDGNETHLLTVTEIPPHTHGMGPSLVDGVGYTAFSTGGWDVKVRYETDSAGGQQDGTTKPHNNMPPYYVLMYIMKL